MKIEFLCPHCKAQVCFHETLEYTTWRTINKDGICLPDYTNETIREHSLKCNECNHENDFEKFQKVVSES